MYGSRRLLCTQTDGDDAQKKTTTYKEQDPAKVTHYLTQLAEFSDYQRVYLKVECCTILFLIEYKTELDSVLNGYVGDMEAARKKMAEQTKEFNTYLHMVNTKNRQLAFRSWLIVSVSLGLLLIGGILMFYHYSQVIG